jgi:hypothetical protein
VIRRLSNCQLHALCGISYAAEHLVFLLVWRITESLRGLSECRRQIGAPFRSEWCRRVAARTEEPPL